MAIVAIAVGTSACFADLQEGPPPDPVDAQIWRLMNQDRANAGLPGLVFSPKLDNLANNWAVSMGTGAGFTHQDLGWVLGQDGWSNWYTIGENLLVGPASLTPSQMEAAWMGSDLHRAHILSPAFDAVGIATFLGGDGRLYVCVDFGGV
jgi:uncharacterized protein YkwD